MKLVHLTDPHLTTPPPMGSLLGRSHGGKRFLGYLSWSRKRRHSLRRIWLDGLQAELSRLAPDLIVVTGDLTQIGTVEEIEEARDWLDQLAPAERIAFVPGNHDSYAAESWSNLEAKWADYLPPGGAKDFPIIRQEGGVTLFGLSSAVPTAPLSAAGRLGVEQLNALEQGLEAHANSFRLLYLHHPPLPGMIQWRKRLTDAPALAELLERQPVDLVLHGHRHRNQRSERLGAKVFCTAPASAERASFRAFEIERDAEGWNVAMSRYERAEDGFEIQESESWHARGRA
ncbi:MAG: metallophosphoesterase [Pseudomonadota bacterium]